METTKRTCAACTMLSQGVKFRKTPPHTCAKKVVTDNHQWVKDESFVPERVMRGITTIERHVCKICGCEREKTVGRNYSSFSYCRSGILFSGGQRPDCIDWKDTEGLNKIGQHEKDFDRL